MCGCYFFFFFFFFCRSNAHTLVDMAACVGILKKGDAVGLEICKVMSNIIAVMLRENYLFPEPDVIPLSFDPFDPFKPAAAAVAPIPAAAASSATGSTSSTTVAAAPETTEKGALSYKGAVAGQARPAAAVAASATPASSSVTRSLSNGKVDHSNNKGEERDANTLETAVLRLRGLPWDASEEQLREFFSGLRVESVVWTFTHRNRPSGEAFVTFGSVEEAAKGLGKHKEHLNKRYIEVFASSEAQAEAAQSQKRSDANGGNNTNNSNHGNNSNGNNNNNNNNNSNSGNGGGAAASAPSSSGGGGGRGEKSDGGDTHVMMYGLPYTVTVVDIEEFFEGFNFVPGSVEIDTDSSGRALGTGSINFRKVSVLWFRLRFSKFCFFFFFLFFFQAKDATRAIAERNRKFIGKRYVNLHQNAAKREQQRQAFLAGKK